MKIRHRRVTRSRLLEALFNSIVTFFPSLLFNDLKLRVLRAGGATIGQNVRVSNRVRVLGLSHLTLERDVAIARGVTLDARASLRLGVGSLIGFESVILTFTHASGDPTRPVHHQGVVTGQVDIGDNTWLGARCIVLPGKRVGNGSIVGALSVVSNDIPAGVIAAGAPARTVSERRLRE